MPRGRPRRVAWPILAALAGLLPHHAGAQGRAQECRVETAVLVRNGSAQVVREVFLSAPERGRNQLPRGGLAPGNAEVIRLPTCGGSFEMTAVFADGRAAGIATFTASAIRGMRIVWIR